MNILILFTQPWRIGGAETHVAALLKGLFPNKIILAVNEGSDKNKLEQLQKEMPNLKIIQIQSRGANIFKWHRSIKLLQKIISDEHIDIISAQQRTAGIWAWRLSKSTNIKYTVTMHDPWHRAKFKKLYHRIFPQMIVVSSNLSNILQEQYAFPKKSITLINNGIDFSQFKPMNKVLARNELQIQNDDKIILHVSRMSNVKGAVSLVIIDALEYLASIGIFYKLIIIGEGPLRHKIEEKANKFNQKYGNYITIKNFVKDITIWYNATDILIGEGRVAIETLSCERPVIAIRNTNNFIGLITDKNIEYACKINFDGKDKQVDKYQMAKEIEQAFKTDEKTSQNIANYVRANLTLDKMAQSYLNVFNRLLKN